MRKKTILLVEDEKIIALQESRLLKKHGYEVRAVSAAQEAIETIDKEEIDLVLMDIDLGEGEMDGTETAREILKHHSVPIVFCTSHSEKEYVDKVKGITRYGYVIKKSGEFVLTQAIEMAFELFNANRQMQKEEKEKLKVIDSLKRFSSIVKTSPILAFIWRNEPKWPVEFVSDNVEEIIGYSKEELLSGEVSYLSIIDSADLERVQAEEALIENEERFKTAMEVVKEGIWDWRIDTDTFYFNAAYFTMLGYKEGEISTDRESLRKLYHPEEVQELQKYVEEVIRGNGKYERVFRLKKKNGNYIWVRSLGRVVEFDTQGNPTRMIGTHTDITEQRRLEENLRREYEKFKNVIDHANDGIVLTNKEGVITEWNRTQENITGIPGVSVLGRILW